MKPPLPQTSAHDALSAIGKARHVEDCICRGNLQVRSLQCCVQVGQSPAAGAAGMGGHAAWAGAHECGTQLLQPALSLGAQAASIEAVQTGGEDVDADTHDAGEVQAPLMGRHAAGASRGHQAQGAGSVHSGKWPRQTTRHAAVAQGAGSVHSGEGPRQAAGPAGAQQALGLAAAALLQGRGSSTLHQRSLSPPTQHSAQSQGGTPVQPGRGAVPAGSSGRPSIEVCTGDICGHHARVPPPRRGDVPPGTMNLPHLHRRGAAVKRAGGCHAAMLQLKRNRLTTDALQWVLQSLVMQCSRPAQEHGGTTPGHHPAWRLSAALASR